VQEFLLLRLPRTPRVLRDVAERLDRAALARGGPVTRAVAAGVLDAMARESGAESGTTNESLT
jgi:hypothetical protein